MGFERETFFCDVLEHGSIEFVGPHGRLKVHRSRSTQLGSP